jgi:hypothetical protein
MPAPAAKKWGTKVKSIRLVGGDYEVDCKMDAALGVIADMQVRNLGAMGGSCCQADPFGDMPNVVLALRAELEAPNSFCCSSAVNFFPSMILRCSPDIMDKFYAKYSSRAGRPHATTDTHDARRRACDRQASVRRGGIARQTARRRIHCGRCAPRQGSSVSTSIAQPVTGCHVMSCNACSTHHTGPDFITIFLGIKRRRARCRHCQAPFR